MSWNSPDNSPRAELASVCHLASVLLQRSRGRTLLPGDLPDVSPEAREAWKDIALAIAAEVPLAREAVSLAEAGRWHEAAQAAGQLRRPQWLGLVHLIRHRLGASWPVAS